MAENEAWSSGESVPENEVLENDDIGEIDSKDFYYNETQLFEDAHFYENLLKTRLILEMKFYLEIEICFVYYFLRIQSIKLHTKTF